MNIQDAINVLETLGCSVRPLLLGYGRWKEAIIVDKQGDSVGRIFKTKGTLKGFKWYRKFSSIRNRWEYFEHCGRVLSDADYNTLKDMDGGFTMPRKAPWPDWSGNAILENEMIEHPDGTVGQVAFFEQYHGAVNQWRVIYGDEQGSCDVSRLCIQVGERGQARVLMGVAP